VLKTKNRTNGPGKKQRKSGNTRQTTEENEKSRAADGCGIGEKCKREKGIEGKGTKKIAGRRVANREEGGPSYKRECGNRSIKRETKSDPAPIHPQDGKRRRANLERKRVEQQLKNIHSPKCKSKQKTKLKLTCWVRGRKDRRNKKPNQKILSKLWYASSTGKDTLVAALRKKRTGTPAKKQTAGRASRARA